jgi:hypothetical protein
MRCLLFRVRQKALRFPAPIKRNFFSRNDGSLKTEVSLPKFAYAPVRRGDTAGDICVYGGGELLGRIELIYDIRCPLTKTCP